ncbi:hypothetical protein GWN63_02270, partial [Candidatus Bathyarchaeota archaeon]|nr:hypothetical protein [Candidatus Bathyarchaeota archaeon]
MLSGVSKEKILESVSTCLEMPTPPAPSPFGDGKAGKRIALILEGILLGAQQEAFEPLIHLGPERIAGIQ